MLFLNFKLPFTSTVYKLKDRKLELHFLPWLLTTKFSKVVRSESDHQMHNIFETIIDLDTPRKSNDLFISTKP